VVPLTALIAFLRQSVADLQTLRVAELQFWHRDAARLMAVLLIGVLLATLAVRSAMTRRPGRDLIALPALLRGFRRSSWSFVRYGALLPFVAGIPFFVLALADPYSSLTRETVSYPGRRIGLMIDASSSMLAPFRAARLNPTGRAETQTTFHTSVAAADYFVRLRMQSKYHDLMALVEFGDESYVITPFTHDYDNILLSIALIGDPSEWRRFPDQGTLVGQAINQSVELFRAFNFEEAAGNVIVIFSDGLDSQVVVDGKDPADLLQTAIRTKVPVYFIRVADEARLGRSNPDPLWQVAVEKTGGKFYAASDESVILRAIDDIDKASVGEISVSRYSTQRGRFSPFAAIAVGLWAIAALMKLTIPYFQKFP
jgi:Ca-activated chloride channel homolog